MRHTHRVSSRTVVTLLILPFAVGCGLPHDWDGDGFSAAVDCDDLDPQRHPEALEIAGDGVDQDCRGGDVAQAVTGEEHGCELSDGGEVWCGGSNKRGQLELPDALSENLWLELAAGAYHTCALNVLGEVACWGDNSYGQAEPPVNGPFASIAAGPYSSIGHYLLSQDSEEATGSVCWGRCYVVHPVP